MTRLQFLTRPLVAGYVVLTAAAFVVTGAVALYAVQVRTTDQLVEQCYFNNAKWIATAVKDVRDARRENALTTTTGEPARVEHVASRDGALFAARTILKLASKPPVSIQMTPGGPFFPYWPTRRARLAYCEMRYPRPWPLG
jgi:hypothetical protein